MMSAAERDHQSHRRFTFLNDGTVGCHFLWRSGTRNPVASGQGSRPTLVSAKKAQETLVGFISFFVARATKSRGVY